LINKSENNILIVIPSYTFGGAEMHSYYTAKAIQKQTDAVIYFLAFGRIDTFKTKLEDEGFHTLHFPLNNFLALGSFQKVKVLFNLYFYLRPYGFQSIFSGTEQCNLLMGLQWKLLRAKHFFWHQWGIDSRQNLGFWERLVVRSKPYYVANSEACKNNIIARHQLSNSSELKIIHNPFNEQLLNIQPVFNSNEFNCVMVANFFEEKDHETLLLAFELFKNKFPNSNGKLFLIGRDNGGHLLIKAKAKAFDLNLSGSVIFTGNVEYVAGWMSKMHVGILSTKSEGLSNALIEYMAVGLPVIATDIQQNEEVVGEKNREWLFPVGDVDRCFELLEKRYLERSELPANGEANKEYIKTHFSFTEYSDAIMELLKRSKS
jgi:glycosyltransferase involved in cell wall biosynthesis